MSEQLLAWAVVFAPKCSYGGVLQAGLRLIPKSGVRPKLTQSRLSATAIGITALRIKGETHP